MMWIIMGDVVVLNVIMPGVSGIISRGAERSSVGSITFRPGNTRTMLALLAIR
jgi:hypothetical protein